MVGTIADNMDVARHNGNEDSTAKDIAQVHGSSAEELVDILDEHGEVTGIVKTKSEAHEKALWHKAIHIWIYNSKGEILLQKRAKTKLTWPGLWDISVAGHVSCGEDFEEAAVRELHEELGVGVKPEELVEVARRKTTYDNQKLNYHSREFASTYLYRLDELPTNLQEEEVGEVRFISIEKLEKELADPEAAKKYTPWDYYEMIDAVKKVAKTGSDF